MNSVLVSIDKSNDRVKRLFASIANRYDLMNHVLSLNIDRYWRRRTVHLLPPLGNGPILDVCTGTGDLALAYCKVTSGRVPVMGTDFCPEMLARARAKSARMPAGDAVTWMEADTQVLPFNDNHFQLVVVAFGIRNVQDTEKGLREMVRVCRPGGRLGILEFSSPTLPVIRPLYQWYFRRMLPVIGQCLARNDQLAYDYLPSSVNEFPQGEEFADWLRRLDLTDVRSFPFTLGICTLYVGTKPA
jgi:demethylmenaquinone methyltransferase/2-methoxy-6-polyprenyl-1,4-benzoquinol methylase